MIGVSSASQQNKATVVNTNNNNATSENKPTEKTTFKVGETIAFDGKEVTVKSIDRDWKSDNQFIKANDGKEFVKVNVSIVNKSDSELSLIRSTGKLRMRMVPLKGQAAQPSLQATT